MVDYETNWKAARSRGHQSLLSALCNLSIERFFRTQFTEKDRIKDSSVHGGYERLPNYAEAKGNGGAITAGHSVRAG